MLRSKPQTRVLGLINRSLTRNYPLIMSLNRTNATVAYAEDDVLFSNKNLARLISLNRPKKLNSLNTLMVSKITPRLLEYLKSTSSSLIVLTLTSPKGLCAGGDVAECARQIVEGNPNYGLDFFQKEYNLNYLILTYSKPYIALMDGITMGGGVGLSVHAPFRVVTERTKLAMPEMDIGFFPDVGTTFFLPRLDDKVGYYVALTGAVLNGLDAYLLGFGTHYVPSERLDALVNRLLNLQPPIVAEKQASDNHRTPVDSTAEFYAQVNEILDEFAENALPKDKQFPFTPEQLKVINEAFSKPSVEQIFQYLHEEGSEFALQTLYTLKSKPPSSLKVALELLNAGAKNTIKQQLELELVSATNIMNITPKESDFVKGVSHKLIDKIKEPKNPQWNLAENPLGITAEWVNSILSPSASSSKLETPLIQKFFGVDFAEYPYHMGLPLNKEVREYITGNDGSGRSYLPTPSEVEKHFLHKTSNKIGVAAKVRSVLAVHGEASKYNDKYVSWVN